MTHVAPRLPSVIRIEPDAVPLDPLELDPDAFQSALPVQNYRLIFEDEAVGLAVGIWDTTTMQESFGPYPGDEFITVLDGRFSIVDDKGGAVTGTAGQSATFRNGIPVSWKQEGYLRKIYLTLNAPGATVPVIATAMGGVRVIDPSGTDAGARTRVDGTGQETLFRNDAGTMTVIQRVHVAESIPMSACPSHRLVRVLTGSVTLTDDAGKSETLTAGDHAVLPAGTRCAWQVASATKTLTVDVAAA